LSAPPRVLLCTFEVVPRPNGLTRRLSAYVRALAAKYEVTIVSVKGGEQSHIERLHGARLLRVPVGAGDLPSRAQAFERAVRRQLGSEEYALVHFTDPFAGYGACEGRGELNYRLVYDAQGFPSQELSYFHAELATDRKFLAKVRRQELFCLMNADRVVTGSAPTQAFVRALGVSRDAVKVFRAPAALEAYAELPPPGHVPMRLLYLGNQAPYQGLSTLLRALALVPRVQLTIAGPRHTDYDAQLGELARELDLSGRVTFRDAVPIAQVKELLAEADVGVLPLEDCERNRLQGGPLAKASDYLAAGRAIVASDLPVTRDLLPSDATVFVTPGDPSALADALKALSEDPSRRVSLGHEARAFAKGQFDENAIGKQLVALYQELISPRREARARKAAGSKPLGAREETRLTAIPAELQQAARTQLLEAARPTLDTPVAKVDPARKEGAEWIEARPAPPRAAAETTVEPWAISEPARADASGARAVFAKVAPEAEITPVDTPPAEPEQEPTTQGVPEAIEVSDEDVLEPTAPRAHPLSDDDIEEVSEDEVLEADDVAEPLEAHAAPPEADGPLPADDFVEPVDEIDYADAAPAEAIAELAPPPSLPEGYVDPWLAQMAYGYCPPEATVFHRPPPPTTFPGRDPAGQEAAERSPKSQ
jgi:glycosyltransferase involved in cell wall biosynthesis